MVTCIGEILIDQFVEGDKAINAIGGAPFNVAASIKRSGGHSSFLGSIGEDKEGKLILEEASKLNLDNLYLNRFKEYKTTIAQVKLIDGERSFKFIRDNGADYHFNLPLPKEIYSSSIVHLGSLMLSEEVGRSFIKELIKELKKRHILISFDINYREDIFKGIPNVKDIYKEIIKDVDILKISEEEISIFGEDYISSLNDKLICLSLGNKGSSYRYNSLKGIVPSIKVKPIDTTGAGDAFFGAILANLDGHNLFELDKEYLIKIFGFANVVGALTTLGKGAINPIPYKEDVLEFIKTHTK